MRILACADKFRSTLGAADFSAAVAAGVADSGPVERRWEVWSQPMADGGEGTLAAFGGANRRSWVTGPLGDPVEAPWRYSDGRAVIEMALASGLVVAGGAASNDALAATSTGTGELIAHAVAAGASEIVVGLGGSATTDGGWGALQALPARSRLLATDLMVACDVRTRFVDAAKVFGPQKGASAAEVALLTSRLERLAVTYAEEYGVEVASVPGAGAAGGLAGGLMAVGGRIVPGASTIADAVGLLEQMEQVDVVVTGEGRVDRTSFDGKVVGTVIEYAAAVDPGLPVVVVAGQVDGDAARELDERNVTWVDLSVECGEAVAQADAAGAVARTVDRWLPTGPQHDRP